jgi:hypothetical protein
MAYTMIHVGEDCRIIQKVVFGIFMNVLEVRKHSRDVALVAAIFIRTHHM